MSPKSILPSEVGVWMIHGNLQTPKVWQPITTQLHQAVSPELSLSIFLEDLWASPGESLEEWAALFCQRVQPHPFKSRFLLGYSLGGRLGFHALLHQPELWQGAIIISADSGLASECDRRNCLKKDNVWSIQLLHDNWDNLIQEWNSLPVFCGRQPSYSALEKDYSRLKISKAFQNFSKGHQFNLLSNLQKFKHSCFVYIRSRRREILPNRAKASSSLSINHSSHNSQFWTSCTLGKSEQFHINHYSFYRTGIKS
ncbi:hypothetical protein [Acaryochloris sp. 'Moss Beach']|uniref:hypothetical protein n=1 Tax=Acaryochloris sp. 'Moss Beach' TaxID=2740837 RepID=UPI001F231433|nr:hypothetical protein [Acaryochloris sp. 'Moss Beach']